MTMDERDLRHALEARSGEVSPEFRRRLSGALREGRPAVNATPPLALVVVIALSLASVGILLLAGGAGRLSHGGAASPSRLTSPSPSPSQIIFPQGADLSAPSGSVVWVYFFQGFLFRSIDRGDTWEERPLPTVQGAGSPQIAFVDAQHGWYLTRGATEPQCSGEDTAIWHTSDGGATWEPLGSPGIDYAQCKAGMSFIDPTHGFLGASDELHRPSIYRTADGGRSWQRGMLPDPSISTSQGGGVGLLPGVVKSFGGVLLVSATDNLGAEYFFRSVDGGASWIYIAHVNAPGRVVFVTASRWLQVQDSTPGSETLDAGKTWHSFPNDYFDYSGEPSDFVFGDDRVGYGTAVYGVHRTVDGGLHWVLLKNPGTPG
jgi:photosystem II stability/assembly factor-like uncharacterized protein